MSKLTINYNPQVLAANEWSMYKCPGPYPTAYSTADGGLAIFSKEQYPMYSPPVEAKVWLQSLTQDSQAAPNTGISESTLLKVIALVQRPDLGNKIV